LEAEEEAAEAVAMVEGPPYGCVVRRGSLLAIETLSPVSPKTFLVVA
jgi:hypothetical protein